MWHKNIPLFQTKLGNLPAVSKKGHADIPDRLRHRDAPPLQLISVSVYWVLDPLLLMQPTPDSQEQLHCLPLLLYLTPAECQTMTEATISSIRSQAAKSLFFNDVISVIVNGTWLNKSISSCMCRLFDDLARCPTCCVY